MRLVIVESPYAGDIDVNVEYARAAVRDCLLRGEAPIASHLLYTQPGILRDEVPGERQHGIDAGLAWGRVADATVVYKDRGMSRGMQYGVEVASAAGRPIEYRSIPEWADRGSRIRATDLEAAIIWMRRVPKAVLYRGDKTQLWFVSDGGPKVGIPRTVIEEAVADGIFEPYWDQSSGVGIDALRLVRTDI